MEVDSQASEKIKDGSDETDNTRMKIQEIVKPRLEKLIKTAKKSGGEVKLSKRKCKHLHLPNSISVTEDGKVYMHTKTILGKGLEKTVKQSIEVFTGEKRARASDNIGISGGKEWVSKEPVFFKKFKDTPGIAKAQVYTYRSAKTHQKKVGLSMAAFNAGSLDGLMMKPEFRENRPAQFEALYTMATAVNGMHELQCIHGDLKPGNLLINFDQEEPTKIEAGLSDFGMALDFSNLDEAKKQAVEGTGTPGFQPPEVNKDVSTMNLNELETHFQGIDKYAFGASVFSVLAGANTQAELITFRENNWRNYSDQDIENFIEPLKDKPGITTEVLHLLKRSLNKDPSKRPDMKEWMPALREAANTKR